MGNEDEDLIKPSFRNEMVRYTVNQLSENSIKWIRELPTIYQNNEITLFHGTPDNNNEYLLDKIKYLYILLFDESRKIKKW